MHFYTHTFTFTFTFTFTRGQTLMGFFLFLDFSKLYHYNWYPDLG